MKTADKKDGMYSPAILYAYFSRPDCHDLFFVYCHLYECLFCSFNKSALSGQNPRSLLKHYSGDSVRTPYSLIPIIARGSKGLVLLSGHSFHMSIFPLFLRVRP